MESKKANTIDQFVELKETLTKELADLEVKIGYIEQEYELLLPGYKQRRDEIVHVLFDEPPVEVTMEDHLTTSESNSERLLRAIKDNPGATKKDLRELLPDLSEKALNLAIQYNSKNNLIENRGPSRQRPSWHLA